MTSKCCHFLSYKNSWRLQPLCKSKRRRGKNGSCSYNSTEIKIVHLGWKYFSLWYWNSTCTFRHKISPIFFQKVDFNNNMNRRSSSINIYAPCFASLETGFAELAQQQEFLEKSHQITSDSNTHIFSISFWTKCCFLLQCCFLLVIISQSLLQEIDQCVCWFTVCKAPKCPQQRNH